MLTDVQVQAHADRIRDDGFTVIEGAANPELFPSRPGLSRPSTSLPPHGL